MKMLPTKVVEVETEGHVALLGKTVVVMTNVYFYTGTLEGVNDRNLKLGNPSIIYETGEWTSKKFKDVQKLPTDAIYLEYSNMLGVFEHKV
jgi:hypothetical protein